MELAKSILQMVIYENDFTITRRSNTVVECHILLEGYWNLFLTSEFCGLTGIYVSSLNGIKNEVHAYKLELV